MKKPLLFIIGITHSNCLVGKKMKKTLLFIIGITHSNCLVGKK